MNEERGNSETPVFPDTDELPMLEEAYKVDFIFKLM